MSTVQYTDYRYKFPTVGLTKAVEALNVLRTAGLLGAEALPENMLGDTIRLGGAVVAKGRTGRPAFSYVDELTGQTVNVLAQGDPNMTYIHIRSSTDPTELPADFSPAAFGLIATTPEESATVLGVWA